MHWPEIDNYDALFSEAQILYVDKPAGLLNKDTWPESIRRLSPAYVRVGDELVIITFSTGGIDAGWGLYIYTGATLDPRRVRSPVLQPTAHPRIYRCRQIE